jgi:hypothetical protein
LILPKILILIPVWQRPEITEICFSGLDRLRLHRDNIDVLVVLSEDDYKSRCNNHGIDYTFFENQPLGAKKNHGLKIALERDWDYLIELNSDDVIKNELLDVYDSLTDDYLALRNFCFLDSKTLSLKQVESKTAFGIARRYSRKAVESCKVMKVKVKKSCISGGGALIEGTEKDVKPYIAKDLQKAGYAEILNEGIKLWNDEASAGMDNFSNIRLNENGYKCRQVFTDDPLAVDIKSDVNIWKFNPEAGTDYNLKDFANGLPELYGLINSKSNNVRTCRA